MRGERAPRLECVARGYKLTRGERLWWPRAALVCRPWRFYTAGVWHPWRRRAAPCPLCVRWAPSHPLLCVCRCAGGRTRRLLSLPRRPHGAAAPRRQGLARPRWAHPANEAPLCGTLHAAAPGVHTHALQPAPPPPTNRRRPD
eukprot:3210547-Prymnesium_polylepis.1